MAHVKHERVDDHQDRFEDPEEPFVSHYGRDVGEFRFGSEKSREEVVKYSIVR